MATKRVILRHPTHRKLGRIFVLLLQLRKKLCYGPPSVFQLLMLQLFLLLQHDYTAKEVTTARIWICKQKLAWFTRRQAEAVRMAGDMD